MTTQPVCTGGSDSGCLRLTVNGVPGNSVRLYTGFEIPR